MTIRLPTMSSFFKQSSGGSREQQRRREEVQATQCTRGDKSSGESAFKLVSEIRAIGTTVSYSIRN